MEKQYLFFFQETGDDAADINMEIERFKTLQTIGSTLHQFQEYHKPTKKAPNVAR